MTYVGFNVFVGNDTTGVSNRMLDVIVFVDKLNGHFTDLSKNV